MPILVDGNNLLHALPPDRRRRDEVRREVLERVRHESMQVTVVFDGPPPDAGPESESLGQVTVLYSGGRTADDVIVARIPEGPRGRQWVVVTDDVGLSRRARARGASTRTLAEWRRQRAPRRRGSRPARERPLSPSEVSEWAEFFGIEDVEE